MPVYAERKQFIPAPPGLWPAVWVDVIDLSEVEGTWGTQPKVRFIWEIAKTMSNHQPFTVSRTYTLSMNDKAILYRDLKAWRGKEFSNIEMLRFDCETMIGLARQVYIEHRQQNGETYARVTSVLPAEPNRTIHPSGFYRRKSNGKAVASVSPPTGKTDASAEEKELDPPPIEQYGVEDDLPF